MRRGDSLRPNLHRTWERNFGHYKGNLAAIETLAAGSGEAALSKASRLSQLILSNAVLARYRGRVEESAKMEKLAREYLPEGRVRLLRDILNGVIPGEYPIHPQSE
jgi:hypothetical protein